MDIAAAMQFAGNQRFSIVRQIGAGGMGVVYEAHDGERNERVALKTLTKADPMLLYQFKQEFRSLAELSHPNLLPLYELFSDGAQWFFTMELLDSAVGFFQWISGPGVDSQFESRNAGSASADTSVETYAEPGGLTETVGIAGVATAFPKTTRLSTVATRPHVRTRRAGVDWVRFRGAFLQLAEGIAALHAANKLHRDLKPENVLIRQDGRVTVLDFGLVADLTLEGEEASSHAVHASPGTRRIAQTSHKLLAGTVAYMSPEQATATELTPASDWYAFGVMLYQALTLRLPFHGPAKDVLSDKKKLEPPAPSELVDDIPEDLNALCTRLLQRDPSLRPTGPEILQAFGQSPQAEFAWTGELPFVGRKPELLALGEMLAAALAGRRAVALVHGSSGAGKSALVTHFLSENAVPGETFVLSGRCYEQESVPYKAIDTLVDTLCMRLLRLPKDQIAAWKPENAGALVRVFPVMSQLGPEWTSSAGGEGASLREMQSKAVEALGELLANYRI